jgi:hypothetical protein
MVLVPPRTLLPVVVLPHPLVQVIKFCALVAVVNRVTKIVLLLLHAPEG